MTSDLSIRFEDELCLVVDKPSGVLSQPGKTQDGSILTQVRDARPDATGPLLVHRLDMDTSGLLLLAKRRGAHRQLQQQFETRQIGKRYRARLRQAPVGIGGMIELPLRLDVHNRPVQIVCHEHGRWARTLWRRVGERDVLLYPLTGRTHQLRVHAASKLGLGIPILGDRLYGLGPEVDGQTMHLHAEWLAFNHPGTGQRIEIDCPAQFA